MIVLEYQEALDYIHSLFRFGVDLGLERMEQLLEKLNNPHKDLKVIHVGGTNGKGSVATMMSQILQVQGYRVGLFISPHLQHFQERIMINGCGIEEKMVVELVEKIRPMVEDCALKSSAGQPTEFEVVTAMALAYFAMKKVDYVVLEVGLGGRLDATNVVEPLVSVITNVGHDHMDRLGETISKVAFEKAGIIKENGYCVTASHLQEAQYVLQRVCQERHARLINVNQDYLWEGLEATLKGQNIHIRSPKREYQDIFLPLLGNHQQINAAVAIAVVEVLQEQGIKISHESINRGMAQVKWPGRMEVMQEQPLVILDGAHNIEGVQALVKTLKDNFKDKRLIFVAGFLKDKDIEEMMRMTMPLADQVILTMPSGHRAAGTDEMKAYALKYVKDVVSEPDVGKAVEKALQQAKVEDLVCVFGSLYMIADARNYFIK